MTPTPIHPDANALDPPTTKVSSTSDVTPTVLFTPAHTGRAGSPLHLSNILVSSLVKRPATTIVQVFVGVRYASGSGGADWVPIAQPILNPGDSTGYPVDLELAAGDEVVARGDRGNLASVVLKVSKLV